MARNRFLMILLFLFMIFSIVPVAWAQTELPPIDFQEIVRRLGPRSGQDLLWDILLYAIFFMGIITSLLIPDKQFFVTLIMASVLGMAIIAKLQIFPPDHFGTLVLNTGMFVLPLITAGMVRQRGRTPKAMAPAVLTGILGGGYFFLFWAIVQRNQ